MKWWVGTSGFSYPSWKGTFYPEKTPAKDMLKRYAARLTAVELNNTFYRMPKASTSEKWASEVPEHFRFVLKVSRKITHFARLKETDEAIAYLYEATQPLRNTAGPFLFQLPSSFPCDEQRLDVFLETLPDSPAGAFEFRHASWHEPDIYARLAHRNFGCVDIVGGDTPLSPQMPDAKFGYVRVRDDDFPTEALLELKARIEDTDWQEVYVFFKHEDAGVGPVLAEQLLEISGGEE